MNFARKWRASFHVQNLGVGGAGHSCRSVVLALFAVSMEGSVKVFDLKGKERLVSGMKWNTTVEELICK